MFYIPVNIFSVMPVRVEPVLRHARIEIGGGYPDPLKKHKATKPENSMLGPLLIR